MRIESVLDAQRQTRLPDAVIRVLGVQPGDRLQYRLDADGTVRIENPERPVAAPRSELSPLLALAAGLMQGDEAGAPARLDAILNALQNVPSTDTASSAASRREGGAS